MNAEYIELPISLIDGKLKDLDVPSEEIPAKLFVRIKSISAVREAMDDNDELTKAIIHLDGGESYFIYRSYSFMKKIISGDI